MRNSKKILPILIEESDGDEVLMNLVCVLNRWIKMLETYGKLEEATINSDVRTIDLALPYLIRFENLRKQIAVCKYYAIHEGSHVMRFNEYIKNCLSFLKKVMEDGKVKQIRKNYENQGMTERYNPLARRLAKEKIRKIDKPFISAAIDDDKKTSKLVRRIVEKRAAQEVYRTGNYKEKYNNSFRQRVRRAVSFNLYKATAPEYDPKLRQYGTHWSVAYKSHVKGKYLISKKGYVTYEEALAASESYMACHPFELQKMQPYKCAHCTKWHIGHERTWSAIDEEVQLIG